MWENWGIKSQSWKPASHTQPSIRIHWGEAFKNTTPQALPYIYQLDISWGVGLSVCIL